MVCQLKLHCRDPIIGKKELNVNESVKYIQSKIYIK